MTVFSCGMLPELRCRGSAGAGEERLACECHAGDLDDARRPPLHFPGPRCRPGRASRPRRVSIRSALGLSVVVVSGLPASSQAALSISSGYETFLMQIRQRIVCAEDDVFDEASHKPPPCDSMKDGPFCRGLPELGDSAGRHRPFTLDSIVPQHLFGDPRTTMELSGSQGSNAGVEADTTVNKQATAVLNQFLEEFYKPKELLTKAPSSEGRLDFSRLPLGGARGLSRTFSQGLPAGVLASWIGAWQVLPEADSPPQVSSGRKRPRPVIRLNGAIGSIRFSRPVVLRSLVVQPPHHVGSVGSHRLWIRARKAGQEVWRHEYHFDAAEGPRSPTRCLPGDQVMGRWAGDGRLYSARLLMSHDQGATVMWLDKDPSNRFVPWDQIFLPGGMTCKAAFKEGGSTSSSSVPPSLWRDLARRTRSIDELSFLVSSGAEGWLLGELGIAAVRWQPHEVTAAGDSEEAISPPADTSSRVVQVLPGPHASIEDISHAAVFYHADDMLERGYRLSGWSSRPESHGFQDTLPDAAGDEDVSSAEQSKGEASAKLLSSTFRSVQGLKQMMRGLYEGTGRPMVRLPPHVSQTRVLADLDHFVTSMDLTRSDKSIQEKIVKKYGHFESFFAELWDWRNPVDSLQVVYERWRRDPEIQQEAVGAFHRDQAWEGSYYCTQGRTKLNLDITEWSSIDGQESIRADLTFTIVKKKSTVSGRYEVAGKLEPIGRTLILEPIPDSWKEQPKNFVMVGLQGVVSSMDEVGATGRRVFAGTVPIFGCDSFELVSQVIEVTPGDVEGKGKVADAGASAERQLPAWFNTPWNGALARLSQRLDANRQKWRQVLQQVVREKSTKKGGESSTQDQVSKLLQAAKSAGVLSFEMTTQDGEEIVVKIR
eukprot:TRINITY_DN90193_c0_g1_i1.p1 TRINITY_DN90193_c0_g1~~TRINITY_DN90193_c0_g1_i1.p1  ORF type:complete len:881 (-),score=146.12 TRINITY_DN90193_c0_g1_i1:38-2680(-)